MAMRCRAVRHRHYQPALYNRGAAASTTAVPDSSLLTDLIAYWTLDEASGTREDAHTNNLDLTDNNTVTQAAGQVGDAAAFTAANSEHLSHASDALLQSGDIDFTFAGWAYFNDAAQFYGILSKGRPGTAGHEYELFRDQTTRTVTFRVRKLDDSGFVTIQTTDTIADDTWAFIEAYHDKTNDVIGVRINNGTAATAAISGGVYASGSQQFSLGSLNAVGGLFLDGRLDEWGFWKRLLTADERTALAAGVTYPDFS